MKAAKQFLSTLKEYAFPIFGGTPIAEINKKVVMEVLEQHVKAKPGYPAGKFWMVRPETASRVRGRIENVLDYAAARDLRSGPNPAEWSGNIKHLLPARSKVRRVKHHDALPYLEIPAFMRALRAREGIAARALEFTILTAARTNEVTGAQWSEFDLKEKRWVIPEERMKAGKEHRVPLSDRAVEILQTLPRESDWLFPGGKPGAPISNMAMDAVLRRMGLKDGTATVHGFRSEFPRLGGRSQLVSRMR